MHGWGRRNVQRSPCRVAVPLNRLPSTSPPTKCFGRPQVGLDAAVSAGGRGRTPALSARQRRRKFWLIFLTAHPGPGAEASFSWFHDSPTTCPPPRLHQGLASSLHPPTSPISPQLSPPLPCLALKLVLQRNNPTLGRPVLISRSVGARTPPGASEGVGRSGPLD